MGTIDDLVRDLRGFDANATVAKALRKQLQKSAQPVVTKVRAHARALLPAGGGLGEWVAATRFTTRVRLSGRTVALKIVGGRSSASGKKSDVNRIDQGKVRHPEWGRRGRGQWHTQAVPEGFFTDPVRDATEWPAAVDRAVDEALDVIRRG